MKKFFIVSMKIWLVLHGDKRKIKYKIFAKVG